MRDQHGQASAELVAVLPLVVLLVAAAAQLAVAGWALWSAANAARAGARSVHVGTDARTAALRALPDPLKDDARVHDGGAVRVRVRAPTLVPGLPRIPVGAAARLEPLAGDG